MKFTGIQLGPLYFVSGERSIYLRENTYMHIEMLDQKRKIYDVSFSVDNLTLTREDSNSTTQVLPRPWNKKTVLYLNEFVYKVFDDKNHLISTVYTKNGDETIYVEAIDE